MCQRAFIVLLVVFVAFLPPAVAEETAEPPEPALEETSSVTHHSLTLDGERVDYTATAATYVLEDDDGNDLAAVFFVAYTRDGADPATRPVTFSFNGGPGAAAVWVHLGAFGPKKVKSGPEGRPLAPPGQLVDNPHSLLDVSDLVFIDPVGTGFSRPAPGQDAKRFYGFEGDVEAVGAFIRLWVTRNGRWTSPKLVAGESYGTTRTAGLAHHLQERYGMYLNAVVLMSPHLNRLHQTFRIGNDTPYLIFLPSYAAAGRYHGKLAPELAGDLEALLAEVEAFALDDYATALLLGDRLADDEKQRIAERLARYTGLSVDYVLRSNLRVFNYRFVKELLRAEGKTVGRIDSRFTGWDRDAAGEYFEFDPSMRAAAIGFVTLLNDYLRRDLGYESDLVYESLNLEVNQAWTFLPAGDRGGLGYLNVAERLRGAMTRNPSLQVLFACGYYDLATPYFDCKHTVAHLGLPRELRGNVRVATYEAGHMMYLREADHAKLKRDVAALVRRASGAPSSAATE